MKDFCNDSDFCNAGMHDTYPMRVPELTKLAPPSQLLFGTDYPAGPVESTADHLNDDYSPEVPRMLVRGNAERLFLRFKA